MDSPLLHRLISAHDSARMVGWDFSRLNGRMQANEPDWDFDGMCMVAMADADAVLDLGTGGGERLLHLCHRLDELPARVRATEGWAPNLVIARRALEPLGFSVSEYDSEAGGPMPYPSASFDLVIARHESYDAAEVARVLVADGVLLTQQVHGDDAEELREWFDAQTAYPDVTLERHVADASHAGLVVESQGEWAGRMRFADAQALVEYMGMVPWDVPGFEVEPNLAKLAELDARRPIVVSQRRFWMAARRIATDTASASTL